MRRCVASCAHRRKVQEYRVERVRQEMVADSVSGGHETEYLEYLERHGPLITFKQWLIDTATPEQEIA